MGSTLARLPLGWGPPGPRDPSVSDIVVRVVCGLLVLAMGLGALAHPPTNFTQALGMLFPVAMLLGVVVRGTRRSRIPRKKAPPAPAAASEPSQP